MTHVNIAPELLQWACERSGIALQNLSERFPRLEGWTRGTIRPTLKQMERFAKATHTPVGYLFLQEPPVERISIPDFRTVRNQRMRRPSPDLLEIVYICEQRQEWFRDFARSVGEEALPFVGSARVTDGIETIAARIRLVLGFDIERRRQMSTWTDALRDFIEQADSLGIMVMCSGVVANNNYRKLDPDEFRGLALVDPLAPLIFVNGADTKAAQMFTLAHEIAHVWLGQSALSDAQASWIPDQEVENWCNRVAAELLVPLSMLREEYQQRNELNDEVNRLARYFKVSTLVVLRRIHDAGGITRQRLTQEYQNEVERLRAVPRGSGGDFYLTQAARVSKRFARALMISTLAGRTLHRDAFRMLGFSKLETFHQLGRSLGVTV